MRRGVAIAASAIAAIVAVFLFEFFQLGRTPPPLRPAGERADSVLIEKAARSLSLLRNGEVVKRYGVSLGGNPLGDKEMEGDRRTPEGRYRVDFRNARSRFHLALRISYPDERDIEEARRRGVPPGGDIMIHGIRNGFGPLGALHRAVDWTDGCVAVTNAEIEEIWQMVDVGTMVEIRP